MQERQLQITQIEYTLLDINLNGSKIRSKQYVARKL
jgi:hypothetical protein